jgi:hypothetical protein
MAAFRISAIEIAFAIVFSAESAAHEPPLGGCYIRSYDAAHLAKHKGQIITRVQLLVKRADLGKGSPEIESDLRFWVAGHKTSFTSYGVCVARAGSLNCNGSLSAAEVEPCKSRHDGVRNCREDSSDAGSFSVSAKSGGVLVAVTQRLEVPESNEDAGPPFLYLSSGNAENHSFLLMKTADRLCVGGSS